MSCSFLFLAITGEGVLIFAEEKAILCLQRFFLGIPPFSAGKQGEFSVCMYGINNSFTFL